MEEDRMLKNIHSRTGREEEEGEDPGKDGKRE